MNNLVNRTKLFCKRNASTILTTVGGVGVVSTAVLAVKATPKALVSLANAEAEKGEDLTKLEVARAAGPAYIPAVLTGAATIACIFGANALNKRQQASLMSAYALLDNSYKEYKKKLIELYGEEADTNIRNAVAKDHYEDSDVDKDADDGTQLFYDEYSNRYFRATNETILSAEYALNKTLVEDCYATLNKLYELFGLPKTEYGEHVGWSSAQMFDMYWSSWIDFWHENMELEDGTKCYRILFTEPVPDFEDY